MFTTDFISTLQCFGYKIEKPVGLKIIEQKRIPKVDRRIGKMPVFNIARVHEIGFITKEQRKTMTEPFERAVERNLGIRK